METLRDLHAVAGERLGADNTAIMAGRFIVGENPGFALPLAEAIAKRNGWPTYADFIALHAKEFKKPVKPTSDDIIIAFDRNPPPVRNEKERRFFQLAFERDVLKDYYKKKEGYEKEIANHQNFQVSFPQTVGGYVAFICSQSEVVRRFFFDIYKTLPISEFNRERHTYITGGSGSGKSEVIKYFIFHYLKRFNNVAIVLIDPHGKLSREVAKWPELQGDRLAYIRPGAEGGKTPVFNPFDIEEEQRQNPRVISVLVDDTIDIMAEILERDFTPNMDTLLRACLYILFSRPGSTLNDVLRFVNIEDNADLVEVGKRIFPANSPLHSFMTYDLASTSMAPTRQAVKMRFTSLLSRYFVSSFLIGKSTFKIDDLLTQRKCVLFNFSSSDIGGTESRIFGKFILAHIKAFGFKQGREEYPKHLFTKVHTFVDECQEFITPSLSTIIEQLRKFGIHLTLAQQSIGKGMSKELEGAILANTAVKITGRNSDVNIRRFCAETGADPADLSRLDKRAGLFCVSSAGVPPMIIRTPGHRLDRKGAVSEAIWQATLSAQFERYYGARRETLKLSPEAQQDEQQAQAKTSKGGFDVAKGKDLKIDY